MAVIIPASGTGTAVPSIATEEVSGSHYQLVKLVNSASGSSSLLKSVTVSTASTIPIVSGGTAVPLAGAPTVAVLVFITALDTNNGVIYIGASNVLASARRGTPLIPGAVLTLPVLPLTYQYDLSTIYADGTTSDSVSVSYATP